jgi:hypothetical protein
MYIYTQNILFFFLYIRCIHAQWTEPLELSAPMQHKISYLDHISRQTSKEFPEAIKSSQVLQAEYTAKIAVPPKFRWILPARATSSVDVSYFFLKTVNSNKNNNKQYLS